MAREFEDLGLGPAEARVIVALLQLGSAKSAQLAKAADVPRTGIYQLVEALQDKGLVVRVPGSGPATWASVGQDKVLDRLHTAMVAAEKERVQQHALRTTFVREMLAEALPAAPEPNLPYLHIITSPAQMQEDHERLVGQAASKVLTLNRSFSPDPGRSSAAILDALERGVAVQAVYQAASVEEPETEAFLVSIDAYHGSGWEARVLDELPVQLLVVDRSAALVVLDGPAATPQGIPATLLVEHAGFAHLLAGIFDQYWAAASPYRPGALPSS